MIEIKKAVILAGGLGTRLLPITKVISKEMLPVVDKPVLQYILDEVVQSGIKEVIIVINNNKKEIISYFGNNYKIDDDNYAKITYVYQDKSLGTGHAVGLIKDLIEEDYFAVLYGDNIIYNNNPALKQLINDHNIYKGSIIGGCQVSTEEVGKYGIINYQDNMVINSIIEKPTSNEALTNMAVFGRYILTKDIFNYIKESNHEEISLINAINEAIKEKDFYFSLIKSECYDCGNKLDYLKTVIEYALKDECYKDAIINHIKNIDI